MESDVDFAGTKRDGALSTVPFCYDSKMKLFLKKGGRMKLLRNRMSMLALCLGVALAFLSTQAYAGLRPINTPPRITDPMPHASK